MNQNNENILDNFVENQIIRRKLLPIWIKVFCWIFILAGLLTVPIIIMGALGMSASLSFYGFSTQSPFSFTGILLILVFLYKGFVAYSLWFEKDNAITLAKIDVAIGVILCILSMVLMPLIDSIGFKITFRLEIIVLLLFYHKINKIEYEWCNLEKQ